VTVLRRVAAFLLAALMVLLLPWESWADAPGWTWATPPTGGTVNVPHITWTGGTYGATYVFGHCSNGFSDLAGNDLTEVSGVGSEFGYNGFCPTGSTLDAIALRDANITPPDWSASDSHSLLTWYATGAAVSPTPTPSPTTTTPTPSPTPTPDPTPSPTVVTVAGFEDFHQEMLFGLAVLVFLAAGGFVLSWFHGSR
jgi:hypothetical protein